ncbi:MAG: hypothetical protein ABSA05_14190 [Opitutaceae bacterium]
MEELVLWQEIAGFASAKKGLRSPRRQLWPKEDENKQQFLERLCHHFADWTGADRKATPGTVAQNWKDSLQLFPGCCVLKPARSERTPESTSLANPAPFMSLQ